MTAITAPRATAKDSFLRMAIRLDAIISGLMGIVGVPFAHQIAEISGTTPSFEYSVGAFFIAYGVVVYALSRKEHIRRLGSILVAGNLVYSVATVVAVLAGVFPLTSTGVVLMLGSGVYTLVMADLQYIGLRRLEG